MDEISAHRSISVVFSRSERENHSMKKSERFPFHSDSELS